MFDEIDSIIRELSPEGISPAMERYLYILTERKDTNNPYPLNSDALKDWHVRMHAAWNLLSAEEKRIDQRANDLRIARLVAQAERGETMATWLIIDQGHDVQGFVQYALSYDGREIGTGTLDLLMNLIESDGQDNDTVEERCSNGRIYSYSVADARQREQQWHRYLANLDERRD